MKSENVLSDEVRVAGPEGIELFRVFKKTDTGKIVGKGVEPNIDNVLFITRYGDTPLKTCPAYAEIPETAFDKARYFVIADIRENEIFLFFQEIKEGLGVF
jgi:hypothetical protein